LARKHGLAGKDDFEQAYVDSIADFHSDANAQLGPKFGIIAGRVEGDKVTSLMTEHI
jgi:hypothetical protein